MRNKVLKSFVIALCAISLVGCEKETDFHNLVPPNSYVELSGSITDEAGAPLNSILISMDTTNLFPGREWPNSFSEKDGKYYMAIISYGHIKAEEWPAELSEVTLIAEDTTGVYEMQKKTVPVSVQLRYPNEPDWEWNYIVDGFVTADFVMKKK